MSAGIPSSTTCRRPLLARVHEVCTREVSLQSKSWCPEKQKANLHQRSRSPSEKRLGIMLSTGPLPPLASAHLLLPRVASAWVETESQEWRRVRQVLRLSTGPLLGLRWPLGLSSPCTCSAGSCGRASSVSDTPECLIACSVRSCVLVLVRQNDHFIPCINT